MDPLWTPSPERVAASNLSAFVRFLEDRLNRSFSDYEQLHAWSCRHIDRFWELFVSFTEIRASEPARAILASSSMPGARWFDGMRLNYAENLLERSFTGPAIIGRVESEQSGSMPDTAGSETIDFIELKRRVARCTRGLRALGVERGDRVAGYMANVPEAIIAALACATIGASWSSASPDFGLKAVVDRFGQVAPRVLFASTHYRYKGRNFSTSAVVERLRDKIPSLQHIVSVRYPVGDGQIVGDGTWNELLGPDDDPPIEYEQVPFDHPLYIMFSSGTTGPPKSIVHGTGGTLIQHRKEHQLHCDLKPGDRLLYFTTCGWMMWNWQVSALSVGATVICYDGSPAYPDLLGIWRVVKETATTHFGTSGKHIESCMKALTPDAFSSLDNLPHTRMILYTGSPLSTTGYEWIYDVVKPDVHLAGIAGGTDILSCFVLGNPNLPVYPGEIQAKGLGVDAKAFDEDGQSIIGEPGELVCTQPLPCMPVGFLNDPDGIRYHDAYFDVYPGIWRHGDFVTFTERGGVVIHGRSDATLNPGGVRIGSAELYAALDTIEFVSGGVAVGYKPDDQSDEVIVLLLALLNETVLTEERIDQVCSVIRTTCSPRHVPRHIFQISAIPVTRSGKTVELSVKAILDGREVRNRNALSNPEILEEVAQIRTHLTSLR